MSIMDSCRKCGARYAFYEGHECPNDRATLPQQERGEPDNIVREQEQVKLDDIEQYLLQMAAISTAAIGYWKEGDHIHPDYMTPALHDVAKLYSRYDGLYTSPPDAQAIRQQALEEAADCVSAMNDSAGDRAAYDNRDMTFLEEERMYALADAEKAIRALIGKTEGDA